MISSNVILYLNHFKFHQMFPNIFSEIDGIEFFIFIRRIGFVSKSQFTQIESREINTFDMFGKLRAL